MIYDTPERSWRPGFTQQSATKCNRCKGRLHGGEHGDAVRDPSRAGYVHKGDCRDYREAPKVKSHATVKPPRIVPPAERPAPISAVRRADGLRNFAPRSCAWRGCGRRFTPTSGSQKYCSVDCREAAREALRTSRPPRICAAPDCSKKFQPYVQSAKYCSPRCRLRVKRREQRERARLGDQAAWPSMIREIEALRKERSDGDSGDPGDSGLGASGNAGGPDDRGVDSSTG